MGGAPPHGTGPKSIGAVGHPATWAWAIAAVNEIEETLVPQVAPATVTVAVADADVVVVRLGVKLALAVSVAPGPRTPPLGLSETEN